MAEGASRGSEDKRRLIQRAAVRVFARQGFEAARVADIAREAGVAYGLVYHYFESKEEVLDDIVEEQLGVIIGVIDTIDGEARAPHEKLAAIASFVLDSYRVVPDVVRVLLLETVRSSLVRATPRARAFERVFARIEAVISAHQRAGELRDDVDARIAGYVFLGALENLLTGLALGALPVTEDEFERAKRAVVEIAWSGLRRESAEPATRSAPSKRPS